MMENDNNERGGGGMVNERKEEREEVREREKERKMKLERERAKGSQREREREREGSGEAVLAVTIRVLLVVPQGRTGYFCWVWGNEYRGIQRVQRRECVSSTNELSRELEMNVEKVVVVKRYCLASSSNPQYSLDCRTTTSSGKWIPASQPSYFYSFHSLPCSTMLSIRYSLL